MDMASIIPTKMSQEWTFGWPNWSRMFPADMSRPSGTMGSTATNLEECGKKPEMIISSRQSLKMKPRQKQWRQNLSPLDFRKYMKSIPCYAPNARGKCA
jgi:hypothetical protein